MITFLKLMLIYYIYLSICVKSINISVNKFNVINHRIRNTTLRFIIFNDFYRKIKEKIANLIHISNGIHMNNYIITNNNKYLLSNYYELCYKYYSMNEEDKYNLETIILLLF